MRTVIVILLTLLIFSDATYSQWIKKNSGTTIYLTDVYFLNNLTGYCAGGFGKIIKTTNGGETWDSLNTSSNEHFSAIEFINSDTGFAVGTSGIILRTTNAGHNWIAYSTSTVDLHDIDFLNSTTGFVVGGPGGPPYQLLKTTDAGNSWNGVNGPFGVDALRCIDFVDDSVGYIGSEKEPPRPQEIYKTTDGGLNWIRFSGSHAPATSLLFSAVSFINRDTGWFTSIEGTLAKTTNGGSNWIQTVIFGNPVDIYAVNYTNIYMLNAFPHINKSSNGGATWFQQPYPDSNLKLFKIFMLDDNIGFAVGEEGLILKTTNGGGTVGINIIGNEIPSFYKLYQNYPNPFNPSTTIKFDLPEVSSVRLNIYNMTGREVAELFNDRLQPGTYEYRWNAGNLPSGVYFLTLEAGSFQQTKRMMLIK